MKSTIRLLTIDCLRQASLDPGKYPSQVLCLAEQIRFCRDCENALDKTRDLKQFQSELKQQLAAYTSSRVEDFVLDLKLKSLILDLIHHINIVDELIKENASNSSCWFWQKQLRFYLDTNAQHIVIRQVNAKFDYTYEYQGNAPKLVHTPLTDKCYLTLTQAMSMGLGGNPYGPAGTGKTESVKALGNLFARQVLVFNCDEGIDVHSMSRIFVGLVQCGAWGCFDEFNRLDQTVLSAVSMQVQTIQNAIKSRSGVCSLGNKEISVDSNSAIFITLNPAGKGYGGRQKLPDNLKQLFRPVAMSVPDNELIAETILYSEGFKEAKVLARKLVTIFNLTREMLSQQQHYDWGLRALKTVLRGCGDMLTANPTGDERQIVVEALLLNTLSKLTFADSSRFNVLVDDVFTDVKKGTAQFDDLIEALKRVSDEMKITITDIQKRKIFELYEQMRQRMGVVLVGPSGCGKSTLWKMLKRALAIVNKPVTTYTINPKAISRTKLLGYMDLDTREWFDGVLTAAAREVVKDSSVDAWIVCDGDIDPEWVEALNSVLDDNRLLTMPSGERIQFGANVNFLFETDDLSCASPATVSRMGMIFISEEDMDAREIVKAWLREEEEDAHIDLQQWIDDHLYR
uniref:Cytoplasmic dynein 2 heavy chain 1 n=1 Tax=Ascaris suum TaxID=6253 RepID=F1KZ90_ASCSU